MTTTCYFKIQKIAIIFGFFNKIFLFKPFDLI